MTDGSSNERSSGTTLKRMKLPPQHRMVPARARTHEGTDSSPPDRPLRHKSRRRRGSGSVRLLAGRSRIHRALDRPRPEARRAGAAASAQPGTSAGFHRARRCAEAGHNADDTADAVLLLGPLYHLVEQEDRLACSARSPSRAASRRSYVGRRHQPVRFAVGFAVARILFDPEFAPILERDLAEGQHRNPTPNPIYFTDAFSTGPRSWPPS